MKNLLKLTNKRKSLADLSEVAIASVEADKMSGGFKEYKPTIYNSDKHQKVTIKTSQLLSGGEKLM